MERWFKENDWLKDRCDRWNEGWPPPFLWLGVSAENQKMADARIPVLAQIPAAVRFVSVEPMLGPVNVRKWLANPHECNCSAPGGIHSASCLEDVPLSWVIIGGESGPNYREMKVEWLEDIVEQCQAAGVPVFVKQASHRFPGQQGNIPDRLWRLKEFP